MPSFGDIMAAIAKVVFLALVLTHFVLEPLFPVLVVLCLTLLMTGAGIALNLSDPVVGFNTPFSQKNIFSFSSALLLTACTIWAFLAQHQEIHAKSPYLTMKLPDWQVREAAFVHVPQEMPSKVEAAAARALEGIANLTEWNPGSFTYDLQAMQERARLLPWDYDIMDPDSSQVFKCNDATTSGWRCFTRMFVAQVNDTATSSKGTPVAPDADLAALLEMDAYTALPLPQSGFDVYLGAQKGDAGCEKVVGFRLFLGADATTLRRDVKSESLYGNDKAGGLADTVTDAELAQLPMFVKSLPVRNDTECVDNRLLLGDPRTDGDTVLGAFKYAQIGVDTRDGRILHEILVVPESNLVAPTNLTASVHNRKYYDLTLGLVELKSFMNFPTDYIQHEVLALYIISSLPMAIGLFMCLYTFPKDTMAFQASLGSTQSGLAVWMMLVLFPVALMAWIGGYRLTILAYIAAVMMTFISGQPIVTIAFALTAGALAGLNVYVMAAVVIMKYEIALEHAFALATVLQYDPYLSWVVMNQSPWFVVLTLPLNLAICALIVLVAFFRISMVIAGLAGGTHKIGGADE